MVKTDEDGRFCESCGEKHDRVAVFCPSCGRELGKSLGSKDDSRSLESAGQGKSAGKRRTQLLAASAFGVAIVLGGAIFFLGGDESFEIPATETVGECVVDRGYLALADSTSTLIEEMGISLRDASAIGTREALLRASDGLNTIYGPAFSSKAQDWRAIDDCGDQELASYTDDLAFELSVVGSTFTSLDPDDTAALVGVTENMNNITVISNDLAAYIGSL